MPSTGGTRDSMFDLQPLLDAWWAKGTVPPMIIATPTSGLDYYMEDPAGSIRWDSFLAGDFVPHLRSTCDISDSTVIAGISGGGHGALKLAFSDPIGVNPLYVGWDHQENFYVASEMKALVGVCERIREFPPGHYFLGHEAEKGFQKYYQPAWAEPGFYPSEPYDSARLRSALEAAVHRQLMCDVPYGVLISGGVDSSVVAAVAAKFSARRVDEDDRVAAWWPRLHSFAIGLEGAPDLLAARGVAKYIGSVHHEILFTVQEGLDALSDVIYHLESFDVTSIRASTPMYLLMRKIRAMGIKMILSGEGADEIFGGYLYFHKAPNGRELHEETVRKLQKLHLYDCARANKTSAAWGVEARVPFLDREFLDVAMMLDPEVKLPRNAAHVRPIEKWPLRKAFEGYIPENVLWRQKEQFSDGVGYNWINQLKD